MNVSDKLGTRLNEENAEILEIVAINEDESQVFFVDGSDTLEMLTLRLSKKTAKKLIKTLEKFTKTKEKKCDTPQ